MASQTRSRNKGQALIECAVMTPLILGIVMSALSLGQSFRQKMKHHFISVPESQSPADFSAGLNNFQYFPSGQSLRKTVDSFKVKGWQEERADHQALGAIVILHNENHKILIFKNHDQHVGVML